MSLFDLVSGAQSKEENDQLELIRLFKPLLMKYAYRLNIEDSYETLLLDFIQLIVTIDLEKMRNRSDGALVKYFEKSIHNSYIKHLKKYLNEDKPAILLSSLSDFQQLFLDKKYAVVDNLFEVEYRDLFSILTNRELEVLLTIFVDGNSAAYVADQFGVSRQNINQIKRKALRKLRLHVKL